MSQPASPYSAPTVHPQYGAPLDLLKPARRASLMMFILSGLMFLLGAGMIGITFVFDTIPPEKLAPFREKLQNVAHMSLEAYFRAFGGFLMVGAVVLLSLAFFVRRGGLISTILSVVLVGLIVLLNAMAFVVDLFSPMNMDKVSGLCDSIITLGLFIPLFMWLISAMRAAPKVKSAQQQYLTQYYQYQQNMQAYVGYATQPQSQGYITQAPPAAPLTPPDEIQKPPTEA